MGRIRSLDSLRGIAALVVVLYHFSLVVPGVHPRLEAIWPLRAVLAGQTAVMLFFVLSGFVLYLSLQRHDRDDYPTFAARRTVRLYLPVAAAILLSAALYALVDPGPMPALEGWLTRFSWTEPPSVGLLAGHLLLLDTDRFHTLDNPMWSLVVEVRLSLLFPLLAAGMRRWPVATLAWCIAVSWAARHMLHGGHQIMPVDPFFTLQYLDLFAAGAFMARYHEAVSRALRRFPVPLVGAAALGMLCLQPVGGGRFAQYLMYGAAVLLVAASFTYPLLARVYGLKPFVWLGERSFSLYLVHVPLLVAAVHASAGHVPVGFVLAGALPACLLGAELFWRGVERPSMQLGRQAGHRVRTWRSRGGTGLPGAAQSRTD